MLGRHSMQVEREAKRLTESRQCPFGGVGFRGFQAHVVRLT